MNSFGVPKPVNEVKTAEILDFPRQAAEEITVYSEITPKGEVQLPCDSLDPLKRRILIAIHTYGMNSHEGLKQIAAFCDIPLSVISQLVKETTEGKNNWLSSALKEGIVPCFSKAELISRLCIEAENASSSKDRINAVSKLMEFRGLTAPEGGAKSFQRIAMKFKTS